MYEKYLEQLEEAGKIRNLKERSITCYKNYVSYFLKYQNKNPEELTCQDVRAFLLAKKDEGLKATTLNLYNSAIRFFYRNVLHILWDDITIPRMILEHKLPTVLTIDEIDRLLDAVDLQPCILPECVFPKSSICIMMIFPAQRCRSMSGIQKTGWTAIRSFPSGVWISLHNTGLRKDGPVESCSLISSPVIT